MIFLCKKRGSSFCPAYSMGKEMSRMQLERKYQIIQWQILFGSIVTFANLYCFQALLPLLVQEFSITPAQASLTVSIPTLVLAFCLLLMAVVSDTYGRKKIMGISLVGTAMMNGFIIISPNYETLILVRAIQGVLLAGFPAIAMTYLHEEIDAKHIAKLLAVYISGSGIGGFIGRMITSAITDYYSWKLAIGVMGFISFVFACFFIKKLPASNHFVKKKFSIQQVGVGMKEALLNKQLFPIYVIAFLLLGSFSTIFNYLGFPLSEGPFFLGLTAIGMFFIFQLTGTFGSFMAGRLVEKYSRVIIIIVGVVVASIGAFFTSSTSLLLFMIGLFFIGVGFFASHSLASGWVGILAPTSIRAYASSYYLLFYYLGSSVMGTVGGTILVKFEWQGVVSFVIVGFLVVAALAYYVYYLLKKELLTNY